VYTCVCVCVCVWARGLALVRCVCVCVLVGLFVHAYLLANLYALVHVYVCAWMCKVVVQCTETCVLTNARLLCLRRPSFGMNAKYQGYPV
jgi:hypothetical protein